MAESQQISESADALVAQEGPLGTIDLEAPLSGYICAEAVRRVFLPAVISHDEGKGHVGTLLERLVNEYDEVVVPGVVSERLRRMLIRRGFWLEFHYSPLMDESVECFVWNRRAFLEALEARTESGTHPSTSPASEASSEVLSSPASSEGRA